MKKFATLVQKVLIEARSVLLEMPVATRGYEYWVQGILNRLGNEGEKGWEQAGLRRKEGSNQRDFFNAEVFIFRTFAEVISQKLDFAITQLEQKGVIKDLESLKNSIDQILATANLSTCLRSSEIKETFIQGLDSVPLTNNTLYIKSDWFIEMFIRAITEELFSYIFKPNTEVLPVYDVYGRSPEDKPQGVLDFYNAALDETTFKQEIEDSLLKGIDGKQPILSKIANEFGFQYKKHVHDLDNTSRLLSQCREEIVSDFETKHKKLRIK